MKILAVEPKDIHLVNSLSITQIGYILDFLGRCEVKYDSKEEPEFGKAVEYVTEDFFKKLAQVHEDVKGKT